MIGEGPRTLADTMKRLEDARKHTQEWYASHYGRLEDWARKILPEPWRNQFFSCVANGTYGHDDVGERYTCKAGFDVVPSGYIHMDDAKGQMVIDQTRRAENAEVRLDEAETLLIQAGMYLDGVCPSLTERIQAFFKPAPIIPSDVPRGT